MLDTSKGKQQILFAFLPGKIFDFGKGSIFSRISDVRGFPYSELNSELIIKKIAVEAKAWREEYRPALSNNTLEDSNRFIIIDPKHVNAILYPLVFVCPTNECRRVFDYSNRNEIPQSKLCPECKKGKLQQIRFVKFHKCSHLEPLRPPHQCAKCHSNKFSFITKGAKISSFLWKCYQCGDAQSVNYGNCFNCNWPGDPKDKRIEIEPFRANKVFYVHHTTLINIPQNEYDVLFKTPGWEYISASKYLNFSDTANSKISDYARKLNPFGRSTMAVTNEELDDLLKRYDQKTISEEDLISEMKHLRERKNTSVNDLKLKVQNEGGLGEIFWEKAKYNILETNIPFEIGSHKNIDTNSVHHEKVSLLGLSRLSLVEEFPLILGSYAFSRSEVTPNNCYLQPFPSNRELNGKFPIFIDKVSADALVFQLDHVRVYRWLKENGFDPKLPNGISIEVSSKAYMLQLFHDVNAYEKIFRDNPEARLVMGLLHTLSHLTIKHAALLCGLDKVSMSEYVIPNTLTYAIYCNHRMGAILGALTALFDQSLGELLNQIENERRCVYDPVCYENNMATCHSCTHLPETSCRFFNVNLSRIYLYGGFDSELRMHIKGFFEIR